MKLKLSNFQIHKSAMCDIPEGETTYIEGDSDIGKSSKLRALRWLCENKPDGGSFVTFKTPRGTTSVVTLEIDGHTVTRERGKSKNLYSLDGEVYEAFGRAVPEPVAKLLRLSPYAFQLQGEVPFLIGNSPTDTAKILSEACGLGVIDTAVAFIRSKKTVAESEIRKTEILLDSAQQRLTVAEEQLPLADALERAAGLGEACETLAHHSGLLEGAIGAEPQGEVLDIDAAHQRASAARLAGDAVQSLLTRLAALRPACAAEPVGEVFEITDAKRVAAETRSCMDVLDSRLADCTRFRQAIDDEPTGILFNLEALRPVVAVARVCGEWLRDVGNSAQRMRELVAQEVKEAIVELHDVYDVCAAAASVERERKTFSDMVTTIRAVLAVEPSGVPMDTAALMEQRGRIKVCTQCGREL